MGVGRGLGQSRFIEDPFPMISDAKIEELRQIITEDYGRDLTHEQAADIANTLVRYFDLLAQRAYEMKNNL